MTLHHNAGGDSILARAPRIVCDGDGCKRQIILQLDGRSVQNDTRITAPRPGWKLFFVHRPDGSSRRVDKCPGCWKEAANA